MQSVIKDETLANTIESQNNMQLFLIGKTEYHVFHFHLNESKSIVVSGKDELYTFNELSRSLELSFDGTNLTVNNELVEVGHSIMVDNIQLWWGPVETVKHYDLSKFDTIVVGPHESDDLVVEDKQINFEIDMRTTPSILKNFGGALFSNQKIMQEDSFPMLEGDMIFSRGLLFEVDNQVLNVTSIFGSISDTNMTMLAEVPAQLPEDYPNYHRSPRIIYRAPEGKVKIDQPANKPESPDSQLGKVLVPPLMMITMSIVTAMFSGRNPIMMLSMLGMSAATVVFSITSYFKGKKDFKINTKNREVEYEQHLIRMTTRLNKLAKEQAHALFYHYPSLVTIQKMVADINPRIYEKTALQHDFLTYRLGLGMTPASYKIESSSDPFTKDPLIKRAQELKRRFSFVKDVPIISDLMHGPVGIVGQRSLVVEQLHSMILQLATLQSYHDVQFISIFPEEEKEKWEWMRWLPHATLQGMNVRGFVYHERSRDQILNSFYQILKDRENEYKENQSGSEQVVFSPHYVVLATNEELILDHSIMEYFSKDISHLGVSVVFVEEVMQSLPEQVKTVIDIADHQHGRVVIEQGDLKNTNFVPDHFPAGYDKELVARNLAALDHQESLKNSIPKSVTFMEMYDKQRVEQLDIAQRWNTNEPFKSLAVPLGVRGKDDIVNLDLHERAHGPHGLIAGTTGSGKSELVQSYILSLALNFQPNDIGFLLIDYKGGGMANLFRNLPHLLGAITNLDGAQSMRALDSIKAELRKRQRLFGKYDVNHINAYQKLFKEGTATEPMPHLFLISDEFAELKTGQPDFMAELVSTARIGRSLGIHLILATQKPTGVVDDQIWSNSKFKISLKVQDVADSKEILKTPDAASIVEPGRAYLQVGNNEIYELFQSAWSGADYVPDAEKQKVDRTIYAINELGQYQVLTKDLSQNGSTETQGKPESELDAVINYIHDYAEENGIERLPRPWLPPLESRIVVPADQISSFKSNWEQPLDLKIQIGIVDIPSEQDQRPLELDLNENSHTAVFTSAGYGKSTFLQTFVMQLARKNSPEQINFYLLDFGTNGLLPLRDLPHVADIIRADEEEKIDKYLTRMSDEIKKRKKLLNQAGVATLEQYEAATGNELPIIETVIDSFDSVANAKFEDRFREVTGLIAREGASLGMYLLLTAARQTVLRMQLSANIKTQLSLFLINKDEVFNIIGRTKMVIDDMPGRGLIKLDEPRLFQTFLPNSGEDDLAVIEQLQAESKELATAWKGEEPEEIPMVPDEFSYEEFKNSKPVAKAFESGSIPFGLELESTLPVGLDNDETGYFLIANDTPQQFEHFTNLMQKLITEVKTEVVIIDPTENLNPVNDKQTFFSDADAMKEKVASLVEEVEDRKNGVIEDYEESLVIINGLEDVVGDIKMDQDTANLIVSQFGKYGVHVIINSYEKYINNSFDTIRKVFNAGISSGIIGSRITDQGLINMPSRMREPFPEANEAYFFKNRGMAKMKFPLN